MKNNQLNALIVQLKKLAQEHDRPLWKRVALDLEKPTRQRRVVNLWQIERCAKDGEILLVPGKVLGDGEVTRSMTIAAAAFSADAKRKLRAQGGTLLTIEELVQQRPDGKEVRILG